MENSSAKSLFGRFVASLESALIKDYQGCRQAWATQTARTAYYKNVIFPQVANELELNFECEFLSIDFALCKVGVPLIFIESENQISGASQEVRKLCATAAPVKILLICAPWRLPEPRANARNFLLQCKRQIEPYREIAPLKSIFAIICAEEFKGAYRFYIHAFDRDGDEIAERCVEILPRVNLDAQ